MSFAVKRIDTGEYLEEEGYWTAYTPYLCSTREEAEVDLTAYRDKTLGLEIVELVEKPAPVVVSEEEAEMLEQAKDDYCAASVISAYSKENIGSMGQDRLMRAYVIGWTVEKPKRWNVKVPHVNNGYYYKDSDGLAVFTANRGRILQERSQFTLEEIEHYGLQDCEKTEVHNED